MIMCAKFVQLFEREYARNAFDFTKNFGKNNYKKWIYRKNYP